VTADGKVKGLEKTTRWVTPKDTFLGTRGGFRDQDALDGKTGMERVSKVPKQQTPPQLSKSVRALGRGPASHSLTARGSHSGARVLSGLKYCLVTYRLGLASS
jgi:hypothetical protein